MMKKIALFCVLGCLMQTASAAEINSLGSLSQPDFKLFSEDLGAALSYKSATPAEPLGVTGFEVSIGVSATKMVNDQLWSTVTGGGDALSSMIVPKLYVYKGLPFNIDVAGFYSSVPGTTIKLSGMELRYAILEGGVALPAVAVRAAMSKLSGVDQLALGTKSLDVSISKGLTVFTPYAGVGTVWVNSNPDASTSLTEESFRLSKFFAGANINLGFSNFVVEYDKTGAATSFSAKLGFRF